MPEADDDGALEAQVLGIVRAVVRELHPHRSQIPITLDSSLDRDLGLDSLARSELLLRISEATRIELPDALLGTAERPRDLLKELRASPITRRSALDARHKRADWRRCRSKCRTMHGRW